MTVRSGLVLVCLLGTAPALAQDGPGNLPQVRRHLSDDRLDRARIADISRDWQAAVTRKDRTAEQAADARLALWLGEELGEAVHETGDARREAARANVERNRSRREAVGPGRKDQHDLRDDRRDLRDDRRDVATERAEVAGTRAIAIQLRAMQPDFAAGRATAAQYRRKGELLAQLVIAEQREVQGDKRELREDRRERREDRRERGE
jgi:hypothetical protein